MSIARKIMTGDAGGEPSGPRDPNWDDVVLLLQGPFELDESNFEIANYGSNGWAIARGGNPGYSIDSPYTRRGYDHVNSRDGGSLQGTSTAYGSIPYATTGAFPSTMTVECWIKTSSLTIDAAHCPFGYWSSSSSRRMFRFQWTAAGAAEFTCKLSDNNFYTATSAPGLIAVDEWNHFAATIDGTNIKLYLNGVEVASTSQGGLTVGSTSSLGDFFIGRGKVAIADARYFASTVVYTGNFTPPTAPLTAVEGIYTADLHLPLRDNYAKDWSGKNGVGCSSANVKAWNNSNTRWGTSPDYEFPITTRAVGDKILILPGTSDNLTLGTGDFCIDIRTRYFGFSNSFRPMIDFRQNTSDTSNRLTIEQWGNNVRVSVGGTIIIDALFSWGGDGSVCTLTRESGVFRLFSNGVEKGTHTAVIDLLGPGTEGIQIGETTGFSPTVSKSSYHFGNIRITKGVARHTSNYTSPEAEVINATFPDW